MKLALLEEAGDKKGEQAGNEAAHLDETGRRDGRAGRGVVKLAPLEEARDEKGEQAGFEAAHLDEAGGEKGEEAGYGASSPG